MVVAHGVTRAEIESRVQDDPFVAAGVVTAEIAEIAPARTDEILGAKPLMQAIQAGRNLAARSRRLAIPWRPAGFYTTSVENGIWRPAPGAD